MPRTAPPKHIAFAAGATEHAPNTAPWARTLAGSLFLGGGARYFSRQAAVAGTCADDRVRIRLPVWLAFLYHVLRIPLWGKRVVQRAIK